MWGSLGWPGLLAIRRAGMAAMCGPCFPPPDSPSLVALFSFPDGAAAIEDCPKATGGTPCLALCFALFKMRSVDGPFNSAAAAPSSAAPPFPLSTTAGRAFFRGGGSSPLPPPMLLGTSPAPPPPPLPTGCPRPCLDLFVFCCFVLLYLMLLYCSSIPKP